jgi:hypothetical protein
VVLVLSKEFLSKTHLMTELRLLLDERPSKAVLLPVLWDISWPDLQQSADGGDDAGQQLLNALHLKELRTCAIQGAVTTRG